MVRILLTLAVILPTNLLAPNYREHRHFCYKYDYCNEIVTLSYLYGVDPKITLALILHESISPVGYYNLSAKQYIRGKSGEYCPAQVMPYNFPKHLKTYEYFKPENCISASLRYLSKCYRRFKDYRAALMCYNKGPNRRRWKPAYADAVLSKYERL